MPSKFHFVSFPLIFFFYNKFYWIQFKVSKGDLGTNPRKTRKFKWAMQNQIHSCHCSTMLNSNHDEPLSPVSTECGHHTGKKPQKVGLQILPWAPTAAAIMAQRGTILQCVQQGHLALLTGLTNHSQFNTSVNAQLTHLYKTACCEILKEGQTWAVFSIDGEFICGYCVTLCWRFIHHEHGNSVHS